MEFLGQRAEGLGDDLEGGGGHGDLAAAGAHEGAAGFDEVAEVEIVEGGLGVGGECSDAAEELEAVVSVAGAAAVADVDEGDFALAADAEDASGDDHGGGWRAGGIVAGGAGIAGVGDFVGFEGGASLGDAVVAGDASGVGVESGLAQDIGLAEALVNEFLEAVTGMGAEGATGRVDAGGR